MVDDHGNRYSGSRFWSRAYADLVDNPVMLPYLEELLGDPAWGHAPPRLPDALRTRIRLDHEDISYKPPMRPEQADLGGDLHGSPSNTHITVRLPPSLPTHPSRARALRAAPHSCPRVVVPHGGAHARGCGTTTRGSVQSKRHQCVPTSVPTSVPKAWQEALGFLRSEHVVKDGESGFMMIDGKKYTSTNPHPSWVQATYGANVFLGVSFEDSGGKKRKRPWRAKVKRKTIGRFETIVQAAHARALYTQTHL